MKELEENNVKKYSFHGYHDERRKTRFVLHQYSRKLRVDLHSKN